MKGFSTRSAIALFILNLICCCPVFGNEPDSAFLFSYTIDREGRNGLHFAWSLDRNHWHPIGPEHSFLYSDYGAWGSEKEIFSPFLIQGPDGVWHFVWSLNDRDGALGHAASSNLVDWGRQSYPILSDKGNCLLPEVMYDQSGFIVSWLSAAGGDTTVYTARTRDFKTWSGAERVSAESRQGLRETVSIHGLMHEGTLHRTSWALIDQLIKAQRLAAQEQARTSENAASDAVRFASLEPVDATIRLDRGNSKAISPMLMGIFFEDINYGADGGLYAELVQNRGFEYALSDKKGNDPSWTSKKAWHLSGENASFTIDTLNPVHPNNRHYAVLDMTETGAGLSNEGFDGIAIEAGERYDFSVFARMLDGKGGKLKVRLTGKNGENYGEATTKAISADWKKYTATLKAKHSAPDAFLEVIPQMSGRIALDMISLFPQNTFKGRKNGLRADLAQAIADLRPHFVRFPGGCVAHGDGIANIYRWKNTIGPLEARKPDRNLWGYHQSMGLGFYEYFLFCEDIQAEAIPIVAAGVPCQNSSSGGAGQQCGIPIAEMDDYIQDVLDLIEYANGDVSTEWGKKRAEAGHPEPFDLKYIGIGNEDLITDVFEERFKMIYQAVTEKYPDITVIGTVGPFSSGTDYVEGWKLADELQIPIVDEHYYQPPGWFINNQDFYDKYDRSKSKVYLGEYASWGNTLYNALAEAVYLTAIERNADVVTMASYAPLLAKEGNTQWRTDLIFFNNTEVKPTVNYHVQRLFGQHAGDQYIPVEVMLSNNEDGVRKRIATSVVSDSKTGDLILKLVNVLPVAVNSTIDLEGYGINHENAEMIVLAGNPDDKNLTPEKTKLTVSESLIAELQPYSLTVIRLKTETARR